MRHPKLEIWEKRLKGVIDELDEFLESIYGGKYRLHPARARRGTTSNKAHDGLFDIVASFSIGAGSKYGRGYIVDVDFATLEQIPQKTIDEIRSITIQKLNEILPKYFPEKRLRADLDGNVVKIHGDLSLGEL